jgi:hypothetical protein
MTKKGKRKMIRVLMMTIKRKRRKVKRVRKIRNIIDNKIKRNNNRSMSKLLKILFYIQFNHYPHKNDKGMLKLKMIL